MLNRLGRSVVLALAVAFVIVAVTGCQMVQPEPTPNPVEAVATSEAAVQEVVSDYPLRSTAWELQYFGDPDERLPMLPNTRATVVYFWDRYAGFDGCRWFLGVYGADAEGVLRMNTPAKTPHYCATPPGLSGQSDLYLSSLLNVTEYVIEEDQLHSYTVDDQRMLTYDPALPVPILGPRWELKFWWSADRGAWVPVAPAVTTSIVFAEGGEASGSGGCNDYTVPFEGDLQIEMVMQATATSSELPALTFGPVAAQTAQCAEPDGIMEQEDGFFSWLGSVAYYFKMGGMLMLLDEEFEPLLLLADAS